MESNTLLRIEEIDIKSVKSPTQFMYEIDKLVEEKKIEYIEAVLLYCTQNEIELETAASLIKGSAKLKAKIQLEAEALNYLPKSGKLPI
jgi:hypothetical protein